MAITNGYATLLEIREYVSKRYTYTAATLAFDSATKKIGDTAKGLKRYQTGALIRVTGTTNNNTVFTVATGNVAGEIVVTETVTTEAAGASVTISVVDDPADDAQLERAVNDASRAIDNTCHRRFYAATETHLYTPRERGELLVDDLLSVTTLKTDDDGDGTYETTWTVTTDYTLRPPNAPYMTPPGPYYEIGVAKNGNYEFSRDDVDSVQIAGSWGHNATGSHPDIVKDACLLQAHRYFQRRNSPYGIAGSNELGQLTMLKAKLDPDVEVMLDPYVRLA